MLPITTPVTDEGVTDEDVCCQAREGPARGLLSQVDPCPRGFLFPFQVGPWCHFTHFGQQPGTCNTNTDLISQGRTVASLHRAHPVWGMMDEGEQAGSSSGELSPLQRVKDCEPLTIVLCPYTQRGTRKYPPPLLGGFPRWNCSPTKWARTPEPPCAVVQVVDCTMTPSQGDRGRR